MKIVINLLFNIKNINFYNECNMLELVDLKQKLCRNEYKNDFTQFEKELGFLQRAAKDANIPIIVIFEGWGSSGKGTLINELILPLDPRGFKVYNISQPNEEESFHSYFWRFWSKLPPKGRIAVFDRSWYRGVSTDVIDGLTDKKKVDELYYEIINFEQALVDAGYLIVKFFIHISKKEQRKRFEILESDITTSWRVNKNDWKHHENYEKLSEIYENMFYKTQSALSPWNIIEGTDKRFAIHKVFNIFIQKIKDKLENISLNISESNNCKLVYKTAPSSIIDTIDLSLKLSDEEYEEELKRCQKQLWKLQHTLYLKRIPVVLVYEGCDAAGKGGNIKRLTKNLDPRGYEVIPISAPTPEEKSQHYLWRFWTKMPKAGHIAIFDRSWYGRVLVERIEGFCSGEDWRRSFYEINEMEKQLINSKTLVLKFWLHIDSDEQLRRFNSRQENPLKQWKITEEDWRNREKWDLYKVAIDDMLYNSNTEHAPWHIIESNCKKWARIKTMKIIIQKTEDFIKKWS